MKAARSPKRSLLMVCFKSAEKTNVGANRKKALFANELMSASGLRSKTKPAKAIRKTGRMT